MHLLGKCFCLKLELLSNSTFEIELQRFSLGQNLQKWIR